MGTRNKNIGSVLLSGMHALLENFDRHDFFKTQNLPNLVILNPTV